MISILCRRNWQKRIWLNINIRHPRFLYHIRNKTGWWWTMTRPKKRTMKMVKLMRKSKTTTTSIPSRPHWTTSGVELHHCKWQQWNTCQMLRTWLYASHLGWYSYSDWKQVILVLEISHIRAHRVKTRKGCLKLGLNYSSIATYRFIKKLSTV